MKNRYLRSPFLLSLLVGLLLQSQAFAHTALTRSGPADGQTLGAPSTLQLEFNGPASLLALSVIGNDGEVDIGFTPSADPSTTHELALPALPDGRYVVDWTIIGADGHRISKSFSFTVDAAAAAGDSAG